jgi:hypothetical protein
MKATRFLLVLGMLALVAGAAHAQGPYVRLSWDGCDPQVPDKLWSGPHTYELVLSIIGEGVPNAGHDTSILVAPDLQDAWRFDDAGCQGGSYVTFNAGGTKTCPPMQGIGPLGITAFLYDPDTHTGTIRLANTYNEFDPDPAVRYVLWIVTFDHQYSVTGPTDPGVSCGDVLAGLYFDFSTDVLTMAGPYQHCQHQPGDHIVTWNGGPPTPALNTTLGKVKALYR